MGEGVREIYPKNQREGLELLCGFYEGNVYDIAVTANGKIALKQGNDQLNPFNPSLEIYPAGNLFMTNISSCSDENALHVNDDSDLFIYLYKSSDYSLPSIECLTPAKVYPYPIAGSWDSRLTECNDLSTISLPHGIIKTKIAQRLAELENVKQEIIQTEDGGNTESLLNAMENMALTSTELRNVLLPGCPKLSRKVLSKLLSREPAMQPWHLGELLIQCSPLPLDILEQYMLSPLPEVLHNILMQYQSGSDNELQKLYTLQKTTRSEKDQEKADYARSTIFEEDEDEMKLEALREMAEMELSIYDERLKMSIALQKGDYTYLQSLITNYVTDESKDAWHKVFEILKSLKEEGKDYQELSSSAYQLLIEIANSTKEGSIQAEILLEYIEPSYRISEHVVFPYGVTRSHRQEVRSVATNIPLISVYPNPAKHEMYVTLAPDIEMNELIIIQVYDASCQSVLVENAAGSKGLHRLDVTSLAAGSYTCQIVKAGRPFQTVPFIIAK